jgi:metallo-beta-lactamase family protein
VRVTFWGAARTVTGSKHLLTGRAGTLLLDCGLFQGRRAESEARNRMLPFTPSSLDSVILSHAHIDHSGALPVLARGRYEGPIHATRVTADLCRAMLLDAAHIQEKDAEWLNRRKRSRSGDRRPIQPLYVSQDAERTFALFQTHDYEQPFEALPGVTATFHEAGHIAGAASISLRWRENGSESSLVFSGDLGRPDRPILRDPTPLPEADYLILEGTYGGKTHPEEAALWSSLEAVVKETAANRGRIVIPAFAVGRTQEVVYALDHLCSEGRIPELPIYVDTPLGIEVQGIIRRHPEVFDEETAAAIRAGGDPLGMQRVTMVREAEDSKRLNEKAGPFITISASGMCEAGRILHHLKHTVEDERNTVVIIGYQAEGTLGRRLVEGAPEVRILGELHPVRAKVRVLNGFSAHADHPALVAQAASCVAKKGIAIVHADLERAEALRAGLAARERTHIPNEGETWELP